MGNLERVIERAGDGSRNHTAERPRSKYDYSKKPGENIRAALCLDKRTLLQHDLCKPLHAAGFLYKVYECADEQEGNEGDRIPAALKGVNEAVEGVVEAC